jgi:hypothetical protein
MKSKQWKGNWVIVKVKGKFEVVSSNKSGWKKLVYQTYGDVCRDTHGLFK